MLVRQGVLAEDLFARRQAYGDSDDAVLSEKHRSRPAGLERFGKVQIPGFALLLVVVVAYVALAQFVAWLNDPVRLGAGFWPAAGLSLALLLLVRPGRWALNRRAASLATTMKRPPRRPQPRAV